MDPLMPRRHTVRVVEEQAARDLVLEWSPAHPPRAVLPVRAVRPAEGEPCPEDAETGPEAA